jgi:predicted transcriptional regulator
LDKRKRPFEHRYFATYPVESEKTATWFSKKLTYSVMDLLWEAGPRGLTPSEVYESLEQQRQKVGRSVVYQTLKGLYENDKVEREWDSEVNAHRNVLTERSLPAILDEDFEKWVESNFKSKIETVLFPVFLEYLSQIMKLAQEKKVAGDFIPKQSKEGWCHNCDMSHEAEFFFLALLYHAAYSFVYSPGDWKFTNQELRNKIAKLYADNKLADPKGLGMPT